MIRIDPPKGGSMIGVCVFFFFFFLFLSRICLVGEKPDKELLGIVGARGDTV